MKKFENPNLIEKIALELYRPKSAQEIATEFKTSRQHVLVIAKKLRDRGVKIPNLTLDGVIEILKEKHPEVF